MLLDFLSTSFLQELCAVVPHWNRFEELIGILEASLQDIVDRWTDGKVSKLCCCPLTTFNNVRSTLVSASYLALVTAEMNPFIPKFKKYILPFFREKCISEAARIWQYDHLSVE